MLSPQLKRDIQDLWNYFWSGGIANPLAAIEQITYLVFLKRLEDLNPERIPEDCRWSNFKHLSGDALLKRIRGEVFEWLRSLDQDDESGHPSDSFEDNAEKTLEKRQGRMSDAVFLIPNATLLRRAIDTIDKLFIPSRNQDTLGDIYEHLLSEIAESGKNGQFRTPRHIIRTMCDLVNPQWNDRICDPACGTSGFLVNAYQHVLKTHTDPAGLVFEADGTPFNVDEDGRPINLVGGELLIEQDKILRENALHGFDFDKTMVRLGWMNLIQHGIEKPKVNYANTLGETFNKRIRDGEVGDFTVILANPPFTGSLDKTDIGGSLQDLKTNKTELLFVELILQLLAVGGRAAVIVPEGVLFGSTKAHKTLREKLVAENTLHGVISLPGGVFQPYTGVKTSILLFNKGGKTDEVWFYDVQKDGETLDAKRNPRPQENDLWDLTLKYRLQFEDTAPAFVDGETWKQWQTMEPKRRLLSYAKPIIKTELLRAEEAEDREIRDKVKKVANLLSIWWRRLREVQELQPVKPEKLQLWLLEFSYHILSGIVTFNVDVFEGLEIDEVLNPKCWLISTDNIKDDFNLSAGLHQPPIIIVEEHDPPVKIIAELQAIEAEIQSKLNSLLSKIEGRE